MKIAVLDDWQGVARHSADWSALEAKAAVTFFERAFADESAAAAALADYEMLLIMRERTPFPKSLIDRLPKLRMIGATSARTLSLDTAACTARGVVVCNTEGGPGSQATAELALGLLLAAMRHIPAGDAAVRAGRFQSGVPTGGVLHGKTLGLLGLGRIGATVAGYGRALGMELIAWSTNLSEATAAEHGVVRVDKAGLFSRADAISVHLVLSERTRGIVGAADIARMKRGAILVNTSRGPLVDEAALVTALNEGRIAAGLDVFDREPLPPGHALLSARNTVLTPHLGYGVRETWANFYPQSVENALAFIAGRPVRVTNPEALAGRGA